MGDVAICYHDELASGEWRLALATNRLPPPYPTPCPTPRFLIFGSSFYLSPSPTSTRARPNRPQCHISFSSLLRLDAARVEHDADLGAEGRGGEVAAELRAHHTLVAMRPHDPPPGAPELGAVLARRLRLVDVGDALAEVEVGRGLVIDALELDEGGVLILVAEPALEAEHDALDVKAGRGRHGASGASGASGKGGAIRGEGGDRRGGGGQTGERVCVIRSDWGERELGGRLYTETRRGVTLVPSTETVQDPGTRCAAARIEAPCCCH